MDAELEFMPTVESNGISASGKAPVHARRQASPHLACALNPLQCAKWQYALATELAEPGLMNLVPLRDTAGCVIDFEWTRATNMAAHLLIGQPIELLGRQFLFTMAGHPDASRLFEVYRAALTDQVVHTTESRNEIDTDNANVVHTINASDGLISVVLHSPDAIARAEQVRRVLSAMAEKYPQPAKATF